MAVTILAVFLLFNGYFIYRNIAKSKLWTLHQKNTEKSTIFIVNYFLPIIAHLAVLGKDLYEGPSLIILMLTILMIPSTHYNWEYVYRAKNTAKAQGIDVSKAYELDRWINERKHPKECGYVLLVAYVLSVLLSGTYLVALSLISILK